MQCQRKHVGLYATFNTDDKSTLTNGRPSGVKRHQYLSGGVDEQRLFAQCSTFTQVNLAVDVVCWLAHWLVVWTPNKHS